MEQDLVKFGISDVHVFPMIDEMTPSYDEVIPVPGAVNLSLNPQGDTTPFYADNIKYYTTVANNGYDGSVEMAIIPDAILEKILRYEKDDSGVLVEMSNVEPRAFGMTFQEEGDKTGTKFVLYNIKATRPTRAFETTKESKEPGTQTLNINASPLKNGKVFAMTTKDTDSAVIKNWHKSIYLGAAAPATVEYNITQTLTNVTSDFSDVKIEENESLEVTLTADTGYTIGTVTVTMDGDDITSTAYDSNTDKVSIASVTGDVVITATAS